MKLQSRTLEPNMRGNDVKLLQDELRQLKFSIADPESFFGVETLSAVRSFQRQQGIEPADGIVNETTAERVTQLLAMTHGPQPNLVRGRVLDPYGAGVLSRHVRLFAVDVTTDALLGSSQTDADGGYAIAYEANGAAMDLQVAVYASATDQEPLITSPMILDAASEGCNRAIPGYLVRAVESESR